jgi:hypothetical protein
MDSQARRIKLNDKEYSVEKASGKVLAILSNIDGIDQELARLRNSFDIVNIAKQAMVNDIAYLIEIGESGLEEIKPEEPTKTEGDK